MSVKDLSAHVDGGVWTGQAWEPLGRSRTMGRSPVLDVRLADGSSLQLDSLTPLLTAEDGRYEPTPAGRLTDECEVCVAPAPLRQPLFWAARRPAYYLGALFGGAEPFPGGHKFTLASGSEDFNNAVYDAVYQHAARLNFSTLPRKVGKSTHVIFRGPRYWTWLRAICGVVWDGDLMAGVPPCVPMDGPLATAAFCKGVLDTAGLIEDRTWVVELHTESRAAAFCEALRWLGMVSTVSRSRVLLPTWIASLFLDSVTQRPTRGELTSKMSPRAAIDAWVGRYLERADRSRKLVPRSFARQLFELIESGDNPHPMALVAGWAALESAPPEPIYDTVRVVGVRDVLEEPWVCGVQGPKQLAVNGYVVCL